MEINIADTNGVIMETIDSVRHWWCCNGNKFCRHWKCTNGDKSHRLLKHKSRYNSTIVAAKTTARKYCPRTL